MAHRGECFQRTRRHRRQRCVSYNIVSCKLAWEGPPLLLIFSLCKQPEAFANMLSTARHAPYPLNLIVTPKFSRANSLQAFENFLWLGELCAEKVSFLLKSSVCLTSLGRNNYRKYFDLLYYYQTLNVFISWYVYCILLVHHAPSDGWFRWFATRWFITRRFRRSRRGVTNTVSCT
jgi:hypothetical protein